MSLHTLDIERWVLELLMVLKQESDALAQVEAWLEELRERVMQRDESALEALLKDIQARHGRMPELEHKRQAIRASLATVLNLPAEQLTLTVLEGQLTGALQEQVSCMKTQLQHQTEALRLTCRGTVMFLAECARFNRLLLDRVFDNTHERVTTYSPRGNAEHQRSSALVNMQF